MEDLRESNDRSFTPERNPHRSKNRGGCVHVVAHRHVVWRGGSARGRGKKRVTNELLVGRRTAKNLGTPLQIWNQRRANGGAGGAQQESRGNRKVSNQQTKKCLKRG